MSRKGSADVRSKLPTNAQKLKSKEDSYRKINAQLEAKTANLVKEAEDLINEHTNEISANEEKDVDGVRPHTVGGIKPPKGVKTQLKGQRKKTTTTSTTSSAAGDISLDIRRTMKELEMKLESQSDTALTGDDRDDDPILETTENLSSDAMIRYLKAKLRVMQEEVEQLNKANRELEKLYSSSETKVKDLTSRNAKLEKTQQSLQTQLTKYQQLSKESKEKCEHMDTQLIALKSELENEKASQKKAAISYSATDVRLNRALEEVEKYKTLCSKLKTDLKDNTKLEKQRVDALEAQNKLLERQKKELMNAFQKQMKLIDILKRQKIHLESARMLAFTEEEFVKALNWDSSS